MPSHAERRKRNVAREVRWIGRHPRLGRVTLWFLVVMALGETLMALSHVASDRWGAAAWYAGTAVLLAWLARRWAGEVREAALLDDADRA